MALKDINIKEIVRIAVDAGLEIMKIYSRDFQIENKEDSSPLTEADKAGNTIIVNALASLYPEIPIISEENKLIEYQTRKDWEMCWLVDPLDGTKEFIKRNGEFTVNIALVKDNHVVAGVVYVPAQNKIYYAVEGEGAYLIDNNSEPIALRVRKPAEDGVLRVVGSRSHNSPEVDAYVEGLRAQFENIEFVAAGSSLKFCLVAESKADVYPRLAPTMEWDTGAGHIVAKEAGALVLNYETQKELEYNKENLLNPHFIVKHPSL